MHTRLNLCSLAAVGVATLAWIVPAAPGKTPTENAAAPRPVLDSPFFPFTYKWASDIQDILRDLGYANFTGLFTRVIMTQDPPHPANLEESIRKAAASGPGILWLAVTWEKDNPESRAAMIAKVRALADLAAEVGWPASIYPHTGDTITLARDALPLVKEIGHPNLGVTINLAHEMRNGQGHALLETVDLVWQHLNSVTINGSDAVPEGERVNDWKLLIRPLGEGNFDPQPLLKKLRDKGYTGPIGLQCFGIDMPAKELLTLSMKAWRGYLEALETNNDS